MSNIDWDFIAKQEGKRKLKGYVPNADGSKSGVTIATGFDLGARNLSDLSGLPQAIIDKLTPFLGIKGANAKEQAKNLTVTDQEAKTIDEFSHKEAENNLRTRWQAATGESFDSLPKNKATVIASVAFQYGNLETETPNFWRQVTSDDWNAAEANLRNFGDDYKSRRNREADYFESGLSEAELESKKKFRQELERAKQYGIQEAMISGEEGGLGTAPTGPQETQISDLSNEDLVNLAQQKIEESRAVGATPDERPFPTEQLESETIPAPVTPRLEEVIVEDDGMNALSVTRKGDQPSEQARPYKKPSPMPNETYEQMVNRLIDEDLATAGPVAETLKRNQFAEAGIAMFAENDSEVWRAAFDQINPVVGASKVINDMLFDVDDDPDYDFAGDPQLKGREDLWWRFYDSRSAAETARRLDALNEELYNQEILQSSNSTGIQMGAALLTPTSTLPLAPLRYMQAGVVTRFASGAAFSAAPVAAEQLILGAANETRTIDEAALSVGLAAIIGGSANAAFGKMMSNAQIARNAARERSYDDFYEEGSSVGAMENPLSPSYRETLEAEAAKETGVGIENLPLNPVLRMLKSRNPLVRGVTASIVDMSGVMQKKVDDEIAMDQSVEKVFASTYLGPLVQSLRQSNIEYLAYRGINAKEGDIAQAFQIIGVQAKDKFRRGVDSLTEAEFRIRVGRAMRRGDIDDVADAASPYVNNAARSAREVLNLIKRDAEDVELFTAEIRRSIASARAQGDLDRVALLEERLAIVREQGVVLNTAQSYVPRLYRIDRIEADSVRFKQILRQYANQELGLRGQAAQKYVDDVYDTVTRQKPYILADEAVENLEDVTAPGSAKFRELEIPDELIEDFLESDIEVLLRHHVRTMGMDILLTKRFGSIDMRSVIQEVTEEWEKIISRITDPEKKAKAQKEMMADLRDIRGLRDRVRGTYGASKDPHAMSSRFIRSMKSINVITLMGGAAISSIPDAVRVIMVEGFKTTYKHGLRRAFRDQHEILKTMRSRELRQSGVAADAVLGIRAQAMSDVGDIFGNRTAAERLLNQSSSVMFLINGLNMFNQFLKEFAGNVTALRMTEAIMTPWNTLSKADKEKLLKNGIDENAHSRMQSLIREHGEQVDGEWLPNTSLWGDAGQAERIMFRTALNQNVDRIIITPGAGDRALWTSTELGSLITQFKSFGQAATMRLLISGLQERDGAFWQGAFLLVAAGGLVNEIKRRQYGIDKKESFDEKLINAIDRSGLLGSFMDMNNVLEKVSNYGYGIRPALLEKQKRYMPPQAKLGAVFGPGASQILNLGGVAKDVLNGNFDQNTKDSMRFLQPLGNHPVLDPILDRMYGQAK